MGANLNKNSDISNIVEILFQKINNGFYKTTDWIVEHPKTGALFIGLTSYFARISNNIGTPEYNEAPTSEKLFFHAISAVYPLLASGCMYLAFRVMELYNKPHLKNISKHVGIYFKKKWFKLGGNEKKAAEEGLKAIELMKPLHPQYTIGDGADKMLLGKGEEGFRNLMEGLVGMAYRNYEKSGLDIIVSPYNPVMRFNAWNFQRKIEGNIKKGKVDVPGIIELASLNPQIGRRKKSRELLEALARSGYDANKLIPTLGFLHHLHGEYELAKEFWGKGAQASEEAGDIVFVPGSKVSFRKGAYGELYRMKFDERQRLEREDINIKKLNGILGMMDADEFRTVIPITITGILDKDCYVTLTAPGTSLRGAIKDNPDVLSKTTDYQALIHAKMTPGYVEDDHEHLKPLEKRLAESGLNESLKEQVYENAPVTFSYFPANNFLVFDRDGHPKQYLVTEGGQLIALDLEDKGLNRAEYDLAKLHFQGDHVERIPEGYERIAEEVFRYIEELNRLSRDGMQIRREKEFLASIMASVPVKAISYYLYAASLESQTDDVWDFLNNGIFAVDLLKDRFSSLYTPAEMEKLTALQDASRQILMKHDRLVYA